MLVIYTGNGKGKTSACVGQAIRALGRGLRVAFGQFMKKDGQAGEQIMLKNLLKDRFLASGAGFYRNERDFPRHREKAVELVGWAGTMLDNGLDMMILDETLYALGKGLILEEEVRNLVDRCADSGCHLVLSGRGAPVWLIDLADIVSEVGDVKHVHAQGGTALPGIEY